MPVTFSARTGGGARIHREIRVKNNRRRERAVATKGRYGAKALRRPKNIDLEILVRGRMGVVEAL